jgi:hypothetical protein
VTLFQSVGVTVATSITTKASIYIVSKIIATAKQMYNAPKELEALEEEVALVEVIANDRKTFQEDSLCPSGYNTISQKLDLKLLEIAGFIQTTLKKPDSSWSDCLKRGKPGNLEMDTFRNGRYLSPPGTLDTSSSVTAEAYSANRWKWSKRADGTLDLKSELAELRRKMQESLLSLNT